MDCDFAAELQRIYDSEINVRIDWMWDGGINVQLGDQMGGFEALETVNTVAEIVPWLQEPLRTSTPRPRMPGHSIPRFTSGLRSACSNLRESASKCAARIAAHHMQRHPSSTNCSGSCAVIAGVR